MSAQKLNDLDQFDRKILKAVGQDARISLAELSAVVGLSKSPCHARLKRLEADGVIVGYRAIMDPVKLGVDHIAFVEVKLNDTKEAALSAFNERVRALPEVEQCHMIAGGFDYLVKVRTKNMEAYRLFLGDVLSSLPHVANTSTYVVMEAVKDAAVIE